MRRLLHLDERMEAAPSELGKKWTAISDLREAFEAAFAPVRDMVRARKANDEEAVNAAAEEFLGKAWPDLVKRVDALEPHVTPQRAAA
jgi:hypothetical protein